MANKFGKILLFTAAAGAVAAGTYYFLQNKDKFLNKETADDLDDDFDDFSEDLDDESERSYVSLNTDTDTVVSNETSSTSSVSVEPTDAENTTESTESVEEFFDEEDS